MAAITLSPSFFHNELRAYSNWHMAFWRELTQNAIDAKANNIWITFQPSPTSPETEFRIRFNDDGCGMSRSTLENVYFVVGETTKKDNTTIGGFGRARIITCFAHKSFRIHTQDSLCEGSGSYYSIHPAPEYCEGCNIRILIDKSLSTPEVMEHQLQRFLSSCQLDANVYINGNRFKNWTNKNRLAGELPFAKLYLNKSKHAQGVLIRVNGVWMFTRHTPSTWQIVLEIDPAHARNILTSNRDGLNISADRSLDSLIGNIWVNPKSAVRHKREKSTNIFGDAVYHTTKNKAVKHDQPESDAKPTDPTQAINDQQPQAANQYSNAQARLELVATSQSSSHSLVYLQPLSSLSLHNPSAALASPNLPPAPPRPSYIHTVDSETPALIHAAKDFLPEHINSTRIKLLNKWNQACMLVAEHLAEITKRDYQFRTGFLFHDEHDACCVSHPENWQTPLYDLLLKPVTDKGLLTYKLSAKADIARILSTATHEVAHMWEATHNETYASMLTKLFSRILASNARI